MTVSTIGDLLGVPVQGKCTSYRAFERSKRKPWHRAGPWSNGKGKRKSLRNLMVPEAFPRVADEGFEPP